MLKYISLIILYLLVISSYFAYVVYEEKGIEIEVIDTSAYNNDYIDFSGNNDISLISTLSNINILGWSITDGTLLYNHTGITSINSEPIFFKGIQKNTDGNYDVEYHINNIDDLNYDIYITGGGILSSRSYIMEYDGSKISVYYPYVHSTIGNILKETMYTENIDLSGNHIIRTIINADNDEMSIYIDDIEKFTLPTNIKNNYDYYGGIYCVDDGKLMVSKVVTKVNLDVGDDTSFLSIISKILLWNVDEDYLPAVINVILIKFPLLVLGIASAFFIRGIK